MPAERIAGLRLASAMFGLSTMHAAKPHFLLCTETATIDGAPQWSFVLQQLGRDETFSASDSEHATRASRLELLAVVRGLEALDQPSRVTLLTSSKYVCRGLRRELPNWRDRRWRWERFGELVPISDHDLWQRVDRALQFHQVECFTAHVDDSHTDAESATRWSLAEILGRVFKAVAEFVRPARTVDPSRNPRPKHILPPVLAVFRSPFTKAA